VSARQDLCDDGAYQGKDRVRVAAYQAALPTAGSMGALEPIRTQVKRCEQEGIRILCCPEAVLGGLADYARDPSRFAIAAHTGMLKTVLSPLASDTVTSIIGFTELGEDGRLYNSAAVFHRGEISGVYRKLYPAIRRSVYSAGHEARVFEVDDLRFGIAICNDSNYPEPASLLAAQGATALFVPANNGLPPQKGGAGLVARSRACDIARAVENRLWVIRADVAGDAGGLISFGSSGIVDPEGVVVAAARPLSEDLLIAEIDTAGSRTSAMQACRTGRKSC
jgi:predicted amidohydrolase